MRRTSRVALGIAAPERRERRSRRHWLVLTFALLALAVLMVAGAVALAAGLTSSVMNAIPDIDPLRQREPSTTTLVYDRHGKLIARLHGATDRVKVASDQIPRRLKQATVAIEDERFYDHSGVDLQAIGRALVVNLQSGGVAEGGSTITQQYVKNVYVGSAESLQRKLREAAVAYQLERRWSKDRILTAYLNTIYYGRGAYGVEAAARTYFRRHVWQLGLAQSALLAALPKFPSRYDPVKDPEVAKERRDLVLKRMRAQGYISAAQLRRAKRAPLRVRRGKPRDQRAGADYFVEYVTRQLIRRYGAAQTYGGGLRVHTTIDMRMQRAARKALVETLPPGPAGALVSVDPRNGSIRAMVASTDWRRAKFNLAWQARRQPGSVMKVFALTAAVAQGIDPESTYYVSQPLHIWNGPYSDPPYWDVATYSHSYAGRINLVDATLQSDNTVYAQLAMDLGPRRVAAMARRLGINTRLRPYKSLVLGTEVLNPQGGLPERPRGAGEQAGEAGHPGRGCLRRRQDPAAEREAGDGCEHARLLRGHGGGKDGHHV